MAIAHDQTSNVAAGTGDLSWTHTPVGTPDAVTVRVVQNVNAVDQIAGVTYGGIPMVELAGSPVLHTAGAEDGAIYHYILVNPPAGAQTVLVDTTSTGSTRRAVADTVTSAAGVAVEGTATLDSAGVANPSVTVTTANPTLAFAALHSGQDAVTSIAPLAGNTEELEHDFGSQTAAWARTTTVDAGGNVTIGWTVASEEAAIHAVALREHTFGPYEAEVMADNPVAYIRQGEGSGTTARDTLGGASGTYTAPSFTTSLVPSESDGAVDYNGTSSKIQFASREAFNRGDTFTLEAWITMDSINRFNGIIDKGTNAYVWRVDTDNRLLLRRNNVGDIVRSTITLSAGVLYHVVATKAGGTVALYIDAVDVTGTVTNQTCTNSAIAFGVGASDAGTVDFFDGTIDEVAVYPTALSQARVQAHFDAASAGGDETVVVPAAATVTTTAPVPTYLETVVAPVATVAATAPVPAYLEGVTAPAATSGATMPAPTVLADETVAAVVITIPVGAPIPTVSVSEVVVVPAALAVVLSPVPTIGETVVVPASVVITTAPAPAIVTELFVVAPPIFVGVSAPIPSVTDLTFITVEVPIISLSFALRAPDVIATGPGGGMMLENFSEGGLGLLGTVVAELVLDPKEDGDLTLGAGGAGELTLDPKEPGDLSL